MTTREDSQMRFRTADGAIHSGRDESGHELFRVSMPADADGYFGRQCPSCKQIFRMRLEDYHGLPDDLRLTCPYCGNDDDHSEFLTDQQRNRAMQVARDAAMQLAHTAFEGLSTRSGSLSRSGVSITFRATPFFPQPLPGINEEALVRERQCSACGVHYAVFGEHRFCPVSGLLSPIEIAFDSLAAEQAKLDVLSLVPTDQVPALREQGVFERINVDVLGRVVAIVEECASTIFKARVLGAVTLLKGRGNVFQRLDEMAVLFHAELGIDLKAVPGVNWSDLTRLWATRHLHVHAGGIVDDKYLRAVPGSCLAKGQRVSVTDMDARRSIQQGRLLCDAINANETGEGGVRGDGPV